MEFTPKLTAASNGRTAFVAEDELVLLLDVEQTLTDLGFAVAGMATNLADALVAAESGCFDVAVLDVHLGDGKIDTLAEAFIGRGIPIVFTTGDSSPAFLQRFATCPVVQKPYDREQLGDAILRTLSRASEAVE